MRVLFATTAGAGHLAPLLPFADACRRAGHAVSITSPASFAAAIDRTGFDHLPFPDADPRRLGEVFSRLEAHPVQEANEIVAREVFGRLATAAALADVRSHVDTWRPDIVVRETTELSSFVAAREAGVPHVEVPIGLPFLDYPALLGGALEDLGVAGAIGELRSAPRLTLIPGGLDGDLGGAPVHRFHDDRPRPEDPRPLPRWGRAADPLVYVTFGSVAAGLGLFPDLYRHLIEALADLPARVLVTVGDAGEPEQLGPWPPNTHVERWQPQASVMDEAAAVVCHGGFSTTLITLAAGVPLVVLPLFADQPVNAARVEEVGAGLAVAGGPGAVAQVPGRLAELLAEPSYRVAAESIAREMAALAPAAEAVAVLERLADV